MYDSPIYNSIALIEILQLKKKKTSLTSASDLYWHAYRLKASNAGPAHAAAGTGATS